MTSTWTIRQADESAIARIAELVALKIRPGDCIALLGDLGSGKTTFARSLVRAVLGEPEAEVPSPTFALVQIYDTARLPLAHADLYRLGHEDEARELGLDEIAGRGAAVIEWPERAPSLLTPDRIDVHLEEGRDPDLRNVTLTPHGSWTGRLTRLMEIAAFLDAAPAAAGARLVYLQGDASARAYARLLGDGPPMILMDWPTQPDGPPVRGGLSYSRIAHLAEGTALFESVAGLLDTSGFSVPAIHASDHARGLMLIEDFGDDVFGARIAAGDSLEYLWRTAARTLADMRAIDAAKIEAWNTGPGAAAPVRAYDRGALEIEISLLPEWYWPLVKGAPIAPEALNDFQRVWSPVLDRLMADPSHALVLRDYHSPNLIWLPGRPPPRDVGIIDFQDALTGHPAFDLVSLLQDARLDVPAEVEDRLLAGYLEEVRARETGFDEAAFRFAYAALGAQRNTKILGIFARLWKRDGKAQYLRHIPRLWRYLERDLSHPDMGPLADWYALHFPAPLRATVPTV